MKRLLIWLILSICLEMSVLGNTKNPIITVICDNNPYKEGLETGRGFSCVIGGLEKTILFDTGGDGQRLLANMKKLCMH